MSHATATATATAPPNAKPITINGYTADPNLSYAADAQATDYIVLSANRILKTPQKTTLLALQVETLEGLGDENFLCR
jgi:hypothetical protein